MNRKNKAKIKVIIVLVAVFILTCLISLTVKNKPQSFTVLTNKVGGDFQLQGADASVRLSDFSGKLVLLFFGYTNCPDVCPVTLANISRAMKNLTSEQAAQIQVIFVSVDPKRDTPEHLNNYVKFFGSSFIGLTGTKDQIDKVVKQYGAVYRMVDLDGSAMGYAVDHTSTLYLIDKTGAVIDRLNHSSSPADIVAKVSKLL